MPSRAQTVLTQNIVHTTMNDLKCSNGDGQEFCDSKIDDNIQTTHHYTNRSHTGTDDDFKKKRRALTKMFKVQNNQRRLNHL